MTTQNAVFIQNDQASLEIPLLKPDAFPYLHSGDGFTLGVNDEFVLYIVLPHDNPYHGTHRTLHGYRRSQQVGVYRVTVSRHRPRQFAVVHGVHDVGVTRVRAAERPVYDDLDVCTETQGQVGFRHHPGTAQLMVTR